MIASIVIFAALGGGAAWLVFSRQGEPGLRDERRVKWARDNAESIGEEVLLVIRQGKAPSPSALIVAARSFVYNNTVHDGKRKPYAKAEPYAAWRMLQCARKNAPKLRMTCGPRAYALKWILECAGIRSRRVQVYSGTKDKIRGHRFLDVLNPDTGRWEIQDPSNDITYRRVDTGAPVTTEELVFGDLGRIEPISSAARRGWKACGVLPLREEYFQAMWYEEARPRLILINRARLDVEKTFSRDGGMTFDQWARDLYGKHGLRAVVIRMGRHRKGDLGKAHTRR